MKYVPHQGDIVHINLIARLGHEQKGERPGLIVSNAEYHKRFNHLALVCPITSTVSNFPTHVLLDETTQTVGVIMCEQVLCVDLNSRKVDFIEFVSDDIMDNVIDMLCSFIE